MIAAWKRKHSRAYGLTLQPNAQAAHHQRHHVSAMLLIIKEFVIALTQVILSLTIKCRWHLTNATVGSTIKEIADAAFLQRFLHHLLLHVPRQQPTICVSAHL